MPDMSITNSNNNNNNKGLRAQFFARDNKIVEREAFLPNQSSIELAEIRPANRRNLPTPPIPLFDRSTPPIRSSSSSSSKRQKCSKKIETCIVPALVFAAIIITILVYFIIIYPSNNNNYDDNNNSTSVINESTTATITVTTSKSAQAAINRKRKRFVKRMIENAWNAYVRYGAQSDSVRPLSGRPFTDRFGANSSMTIVAAASTLWIANLRLQFNDARDWIRRGDLAQKFARITKEIDVADAVNYYVGGLLSCYALSGDTVFLNAAHRIADTLSPAYESTLTGLPYWKIRPAQSAVSLAIPFLSAIGGQHLEYVYLAAALRNRNNQNNNTDNQANNTNNRIEWQKYHKRVQRIRDTLAKIDRRPYSLFRLQIDVRRAAWHSKSVTFESKQRIFYDYLLKSYVQSRGDDRGHRSIELFRDAIAAANRSAMIVRSAATGELYLRQYNLESPARFRYAKYMPSDACAMAAIFAYASAELTQLPGDERKHEIDRINDRYRRWAIAIADTCIAAANRTATGLPPHRFYFDLSEDDEPDLHDSGRHVLRSELAETYFVMWRMTRAQKYREAAWRLATSIEQHCRVPAINGNTGNPGNRGYTAIVDVDHIPADQRADLQHVDFLSATLKYLYLIFSDEDIDDYDNDDADADVKISLNDWVFNARGQPLPICGRHHTYTIDLCSPSE